MSKLLDLYGFDYYNERMPQVCDMDYSFARVIAQHKGRYVIVVGDDIVSAEITGNYRHNLEQNGGYPIVGDYVLVTNNDTGSATIHKILPRFSMFYRKENWKKNAVQVLASNFNTVLLCTSLNRDFNITRLTRYMILASESGAKIAIVLTKLDLSDDAESKITLCKERFPNVPILSVSAKTREGLDNLNEYFREGETVILLGSSGVGKSSLVNAFCNQEVMRVAEIRDYDDKGRHTTVHRQIIKLPNGGLIIDTPGIREVGLIRASEGIHEIYDDIEMIAKNCKYGNCSHTHEKDCAIRQAIDDGEITEEQFRSYIKLSKENAYADDKEDYMFDKWQRSKKKSRDLRECRKKK